MKEFFDSTVFSIGGRDVTGEALVHAVAVFLLGFIGSLVLARLIGRRIAKGRHGERISQPVQKAIFWCLLVVTVLTTMNLLQVPVSSFAFLGGAFAIGVGFGAQNVLNNFISGWILIAERPVRIGDFVEIAGHEGRVHSIGGRSTRIRRVDGIDILVPNSYLLENTIINWMLTDDLVRTSVEVGVAYGSDVSKVRSVLLQVLEENQGVIGETAPEILFVDFGDSSLVFQCLFWCRASGNLALRKLRSEIRFAIDEAFSREQITIAFPQRDVHMNTLSPLSVQIVSDQ